MKPGDRVRTAEHLDHTGWPQSHSRRPGALGTVIHINRPSNVYRVEHDGTEATYYASELTEIEAEQEAPATTAERLSALAASNIETHERFADRLIELEQWRITAMDELEAFRSELRGIEKLYADSVRRLLECYSAEQLRAVASGLRAFCVDAHSPGRGVAELLDELVRLADGEEP